MSKRFARLSKFLPFMPAFGGGRSRFQPVYVDDVARIVEIVSRRDVAMRSVVDGKTLEVGGPEGGCPVDDGALMTHFLDRSVHVS